METYCRCCNEEPCGPDCSAECEASVHFAYATDVINGISMCDNCAKLACETISAERKYAAKYDYACGYHN